MEKKKSKNLKIIVEIISCILGILLIIAGLYFWKSKGSNKELKLIPSQSFEILSSKPVVEGEEHYFRSEIKNITKEPITISKIVITYISEEKEELAKENTEALIRGSKNLLKHIENIKEKFGLRVIVAINKFNQDTETEINLLKEILEEKKVSLSLVEACGKGGMGAIDLAEKIVKLCEENKAHQFQYIYSLEDSTKEKIEKVAKNIYNAKLFVRYNYIIFY